MWNGDCFEPIISLVSRRCHLCLGPSLFLSRVPAFDVGLLFPRDLKPEVQGAWYIGM